MLGPVAVVRDGQSVALGGPRQQAVLAVLLAAANRVVPADRLIEEVWAGSSLTEATDSLHVYVSNLRRALGADRLERLSGGYRLHVEPGELDAEVFETETDEARLLLDSHPHRANEILTRALERWGGDPYQGIDGPSVSAAANQLTERHLAALEDALEARVALGQHHEVVAELRDFCDKHPLRERVWATWMLALYRDGRQAEALAAFRRLRTLLGEELGIEPSPELRRLEERILFQDSGLDLVAKTPNNLPAQLNSFVGRDRELVDAGKLLANARLVTLTGVGGSGKTRLALELARAALDGFPDGVWLVDLGHITDPAVVPSTIAKSLNIPVPKGPGAVGVLRDVLRSRTTLIVLDGFEHVIEAAALVATLLEAAPNLRMLVTSRERLRISGEHLFEVPPLELSAATSLFVDRAIAVLSGFHPDGDDLRQVEAICDHLDRLPLSIELAAGQADVWSPAELRKRLRSRLATLTGGPRDRPNRQATLKDTIDWSYDLLSSDEQVLLGSMGVFHGGCTIAAAEAVCGPGMSGDVLDGLNALAHKSLIVRRSGPGGVPRFSMLATIQEYARRLLAEELDTTAVRDAHCDYYVEYLDRNGPHLRWGDSANGWEILTADNDNYRAALAWAFSEGDLLQGARLLGSCQFWEENEAWSELERWQNEALEHADSLEPLARARLYLALSHSRHGHRDPRWLCEEALEWAEVAGDRFVIAQARFNLAWAYAGDRANHELALSLCRRAVDETRQFADVPGLTAHALVALGELYRSHGDDEEAKRPYEEALHIARRSHNRPLAAIVLLNLAFIAGHQGDYSGAERHATQALTDAKELTDQTLMAFGLEGVALAATAAGRVRRGARLFGAAEHAHEMLGITPDPADQLEYDRARATLGELLEPADLEALLAEGHAMTVSDAVEFALEGTAD